jgi:hypothetical protein
MMFYRTEIRFCFLQLRNANSDTHSDDLILNDETALAKDLIDVVPSVQMSIAEEFDCSL